jgi:hypothetical protein
MPSILKKPSPDVHGNNINLTNNGRAGNAVKLSKQFLLTPGEG